MSNVIIDREKIDLLANAISDKSSVPIPMTLAEMVEAVDSIETGGGGITPTGNINITQAGVTDVTNYATATVQQGDVNVGATTGFYTQNNVRKWHFKPFANIETGDYAGTVGFLEDNYYKSGYDQIFNAIASGTSVTPTESSQTIGGANYMMAGAVTVNAIPSNYVGSGITQRSSSDLTVSSATVTAPAGYYAEAASKSVSSMTLPTSAASSATSGYTSKATIGRSTAAQYINIPPGYNSTGAYYVISAVANGSATAPASISGTAASVSTGTNTLTLTKTVSVTPTVSAGYVSSGTAGNSSVSLTASVTTKAAATITPTTTNQTIAAGTYLTGAQTIAGDADLVGGNILSTANIFGVQGTVVVQNYYTGSSAPSSSTGSNGDLYLQS